MKSTVKAERVLLAGMLIAPSFLFQQDIAIRWIQVLLFIILSIVSGKKFRLFPLLVMAFGIITANLIIPSGKVIFSFMSLSITTGALEKGLSRTALLVGMIYLSRFSVRKGLSIPGRMGYLMSLVFFYFDKILEGEKIGRGNIMEKIDERLLAVQESSHEFDLFQSKEQYSPEKHSLRGEIGLLFLVLLNWGLFFLPYFHPFDSNMHVGL